MFGLFKDKKKELAKEIYGVFKPKIEFVGGFLGLAG